MCGVISYDKDFSDLALWRFVRNWYRAIKPDIIHCHGVNAGIVGRLFQKFRKAKVVYTEHLWTADYHLNN